MCLFLVDTKCSINESQQELIGEIAKSCTYYQMCDDLCISAWFAKEQMSDWALWVAQLIKNPPAMQETWFDSWVGKFPWRRDRLPTPVFLGFPGGSVKNLPTMQETRVRSLSWEDPLEKGMATHSSILAGESPRTEEPSRLQFMRSKRVRHDRATKHSIAQHMWVVGCVWRGHQRANDCSGESWNFTFKLLAFSNMKEVTPHVENILLQGCGRGISYSLNVRSAPTVPHHHASFRSTEHGIWPMGGKKRKLFCVKPLRCGWCSHWSIAWVTLTEAVKA